MGRHYQGDARRVFPIRLAAAELELLERAANRAQPFAPSRPSVGEFVRDAALAHARLVLSTVARPGEAAPADARQEDLARRLEARAVAIVGCGKAKRKTPAAARDLYIGDVTRWALELAELELGAARVRVLSAKYGLVTLARVLEPYELELAELRRRGGAELEAWRDALAPALRAFLERTKATELRVYAGEDYAAELRRALEVGLGGELRVSVLEPLEGLTTGRRRSRLLELLERARKRNTSPVASSSSSAPAASSSPKNGARRVGGTAGKGASPSLAERVDTADAGRFAWREVRRGVFYAELRGAEGVLGRIYVKRAGGDERDERGRRLYWRAGWLPSRASSLGPARERLTVGATRLEAQAAAVRLAERVLGAELAR